MSFLVKVAALRREFRVPEDLPLPVAICGITHMCPLLSPMCPLLVHGLHPPLTLKK